MGMSSLAVGGGALFSAIGSIGQGRAAEASANYNAAMARRNAEIVAQQSGAAQQQQQRQAQQRLGAMLASAGASGLAGSTSVSDVLADSARQAEFERQSIAYNYQLKAQGLLSQSDMYTRQGAEAVQAGNMAATSALIQGAYSAYGMSGGGAPAAGAGTGTTLSQYDQADFSRGFTF